MSAADVARMADARDLAEKVLQAIGWVEDPDSDVIGVDEDWEQTVTDQMTVFMEAMLVFRERNARHGDAVWQASGWRGMLTDMRKKLERLWGEYWPSRSSYPDLDSAIDLINFTVFFVRQVRDGNINGSWQWETRNGEPF